MRGNEKIVKSSFFFFFTQNKYPLYSVHDHNYASFNTTSQLKIDWIYY